MWGNLWQSFQILDLEGEMCPHIIKTPLLASLPLIELNIRSHIFNIERLQESQPHKTYSFFSRAVVQLHLALPVSTCLIYKTKTVLMFLSLCLTALMFAIVPHCHYLSSINQEIQNKYRFSARTSHLQERFQIQEKRMQVLRSHMRVSFTPSHIQKFVMEMDRQTQH